MFRFPHSETQSFPEVVVCDFIYLRHAKRVEVIARMKHLDLSVKILSHPYHGGLGVSAEHN